jgi:hypothetical protein
MSSPRTGLSPEWDRGFDEAFAELVSHDDDLVRAEFASLTAASWPGRCLPPRGAPGEGCAHRPAGD